MSHGGARLGAGRPPKSGPKPRAEAAEVKQARVEVKPLVETGKEPLAYMLAVMNDEDADESRRDRMAVAAAPYLHPKIGEGGKKDQKNRAAKTAGGGKFAPAAPPKLVVNNK